MSPTAIAGPRGTPTLEVGRKPSLGERLGYDAADRLLIINGDDAGMSHAANAATIDALEHGLMTCATIMMPCPWVPEIAAYARAHPQTDFALHLTHTSELFVHAALPTDEMKEITGSWQDRATEHQLFAQDPEIRQILLDQGVKFIGYRALRDLQRKAHGPSPK